MKINLPKKLESSIEAAVRSGHFASVDEAMAEAARRLLRELSRTPTVNVSPDLVTGSMRDDAELMDEIVAHAYRHRGL